MFARHHLVLKATGRGSDAALYLIPRRLLAVQLGRYHLLRREGIPLCAALDVQRPFSTDRLVREGKEEYSFNMTASEIIGKNSPYSHASLLRSIWWYVCVLVVCVLVVCVHVCVCCAGTQSSAGSLFSLCCSIH